MCAGRRCRRSAVCPQVFQATVYSLLAFVQSYRYLGRDTSAESPGLQRGCQVETLGNIYEIQQLERQLLGSDGFSGRQCLDTHKNSV